MRTYSFTSSLVRAALAASALLAASGACLAQTTPQQVNLTAAPTSVLMTDGSLVPMWGYGCGTAVSGSTATCAAANPNAPAATTTAPAGWSPVVITIPYTSTTTTSGTLSTTTLQINLANHLQFTPTGSTTPNSIPTSLTIVGQLGGGLGTVGTSCVDSAGVGHGASCTPSPAHGSQVVTWSTVGSSPAFTPPSQGPRVQSFATEIAATPSTSTSSSPLCWGNCATGQPGLNPGTYLIESGTHPSIQGTMGLYGVLVVTSAPVGTTAGTAYPAAGTAPAVTYNAEIPMLFGEIDPVQNNAVSAAVGTTGFNETMVWSGQPGGCGNPTSPTYHQCYPPTVNYTPLYYTINGVAFNKTSATGSLFPATPVTATAGTGQVLVRLVNAGSRMHVPSIVGSQTQQLAAGNTTGTTVNGFSLIAEDGNPLPGLPRVQSEVFMAAGKTYDVMINVPAAGGTALPIYDRELSLSGNAIARDAGMLAYISVNGAGLPTAPALAGAVAMPDTYNSLVAGQTLAVSDPSKGVIANDKNVYGVQLLTAPSNGTVTLNANGTFTYVPTGTATSDSFVYEANGNPGITAKVILGAAPIESSGGITVNPITYMSTMATYIKIPPAGVLLVDSDAKGYPLSVAAGTVK